MLIRDLVKAAQLLSKKMSNIKTCTYIGETDLLPNRFIFRDAICTLFAYELPENIANSLELYGVYKLNLDDDYNVIDIEII